MATKESGPGPLDNRIVERRDVSCRGATVADAGKGQTGHQSA